jgi:tryptophan-rich sensory protein
MEISEIKDKPLKLLGFIIAPNMGGALIGFLSMTDMVWYNSLTKPGLTPPGLAFPIAWTILYSLMGLSFYVALGSDVNREGKALFLIQYVANLAWTPVFFMLNAPFQALLILVFLNVAVAGTIYEFYKSSKISAYLLLPYMAWILFALYLNLSIVLLN